MKYSEIWPADNERTEVGVKRNERFLGRHSDRHSQGTYSATHQSSAKMCDRFLTIQPMATMKFTGTMQSSELDGDRRRVMNGVGEVAIDLQDTGRTTGENCRREIFHVNERARSEKDSEDGVDGVPPKPSSVNLDMVQG